MVRRGASLDANQAWWQLLEEHQDGAALQPPADDHLAGGINSVDLEDRLRDVETDRRDRLHDWLLRIVGASTAPTSVALACRWRSRPQHQKRKSIRTGSASHVQSSRLASCAPSVNAAILAQASWGWSRPPSPQSVPAMTFSRPTSPA